MHKERRIFCDSSKRERERERDRVSPYPLRSSRNNKQKEYEYESHVESESSRQLQWEDVRCVICMEPPHNALLLQCASSSKGCRPYMCDTSARHSNCFKQFRRKNTNRLTRNTLKSPLKCPLCRGEVYGTMKLTCARRYMNAKHRCCTVDNCDFSGTYSQLKTHLKAQHQDLTQQRLDLWEQQMWEQLERERESERIQIQTQRRRLLLANTLHQHQDQHQHQHQLTPPLVHNLNFDDFLLHYVSASMGNQPTTLVTSANYQTHIPRFDYITAHTYSTHITQFDYPPTIYPTWIP